MALAHIAVAVIRTMASRAFRMARVGNLPDCKRARPFQQNRLHESLGPGTRTGFWTLDLNAGKTFRPGVFTVICNLHMGRKMQRYSLSTTSRVLFCSFQIGSLFAAGEPLMPPVWASLGLHVRNGREIP